MAAGGVRRRKDIDRFNQASIEKNYCAANNIPNKAILNTMTQIRLAGDAISYLSKNTYE